MEDQEKHLFFMSTYSNISHTYYLRLRADIYIPVGCDHREPVSYGFMQEIRLKPNEVQAVDKQKVSLWTDMGILAFEVLISGIMIHN